MNEVASRQLGEGPHRTSKIPSELIEHSERRNAKGKGRERSESIESQDEIRKQTERHSKEVYLTSNVQIDHSSRPFHIRDSGLDRVRSKSKSKSKSKSRDSSPTKRSASRNLISTAEIANSNASFTSEDMSNVVLHLASSRLTWGGASISHELASIFPNHSFESYREYLMFNVDCGHNLADKVNRFKREHPEIGGNQRSPSNGIPSILVSESPLNEAGSSNSASRVVEEETLERNGRMMRRRPPREEVQEESLNRSGRAKREAAKGVYYKELPLSPVASSSSEGDEEEKREESEQINQAKHQEKQSTPRPSHRTASSPSARNRNDLEQAQVQEAGDRWTTAEVKEVVFEMVKTNRESASSTLATQLVKELGKRSHAEYLQFISENLNEGEDLLSRIDSFRIFMLEDQDDEQPEAEGALERRVDAPEPFSRDSILEEEPSQAEETERRVESPKAFPNLQGKDQIQPSTQSSGPIPPLPAQAEPSKQSRLRISALICSPEKRTDESEPSQAIQPQVLSSFESPPPARTLFSSASKATSTPRALKSCKRKPQGVYASSQVIRVDSASLSLTPNEKLSKRHKGPIDLCTPEPTSTSTSNQVSAMRSISFGAVDLTMDSDGEEELLREVAGLGRDPPLGSPGIVEEMPSGSIVSEELPEQKISHAAPLFVSPSLSPADPVEQQAEGSRVEQAEDEESQIQKPNESLVEALQVQATTESQGAVPQAEEPEPEEPEFEEPRREEPQLAPVRDLQVEDEEDELELYELSGEEMVEKLGEEDLINQDLSGDMDGEEMDLDEVQLDESQPEESNRQDLSLEDIDGCEMEPDEVQVDEYSDWRSEGSDPPPFEAESDHGLKEVLEMGIAVDESQIVPEEALVLQEENLGNESWRSEEGKQVSVEQRETLNFSPVGKEVKASSKQAQSSSSLSRSFISSKASTQERPNANQSKPQVKSSSATFSSPKQPLFSPPSFDRGHSKHSNVSLANRIPLKKGSFGSADSTHSTSHPPEDLNDSDYEAYKKSMNELKEEYGINYAQMKKLKVIPGSGKIREIRKRLEEKIGKAAKKWGWGREEAIEALEDADWDFEEMELQLNAGSLLPRSEI